MRHEDLRSIMIDEEPILVGARAKLKYKPFYEKLLTRYTRFGEEYKLYEVVGDYIYVPRGLCKIGKNTVDKRTVGSNCSFVSKVVPRNEEQVRLIKESLSLLQQSKDHILRAGTGTGKSVIGLDIIAKINKPALIIVPETSLMDQWVQNIHKFLDIPESRIGVIQQNVYDYKGKWVVLGMLQSLALKEDYPRDMYDYFGFMVVDEVHRAASEELGRVCSLFSAKLRLGLSATPDRSDGRELYLQSHIGPIRVVSDATPMNFKVLQYKSTWACPRRKVYEYGYESFVKLDHTPAKCGHIINSIAKHETTNKRIASWIKKAYDKDRFIMVMSDRLNHLDTLIALTARAGVPSHSMHKYIGGMKKEEIKKAKDSKIRVLFGTFQKLGTGVDIPWYDTLILCTPRANIKQFVGRILREYPGKKEPIVVDIDYEDSPVFKKYGTARGKYYAQVGAEVKSINKMRGR